jgi:general secretion pathway protein J
VIKQHTEIRMFSLVEVLVAMMLLSFIIVASMSALQSTKESALYSYNQERDIKKLNAILNLIRNDLQHMIYPRGDEEILHTHQVDLNDGRADSISFIKLPHLSTIENYESLLSEISYVSSPNPDDDNIFNLYRREQNNPDEDINTGGFYELLIEDLVDFQLNYLEGDQWTSTPTTLPRAVEVNITLQKDDFKGGFKHIHLKTIIALQGKA